MPVTNMAVTSMAGTLGMVGFLTLLALAAAGLLLWLVMRLTGRVSFLERQTHDLAAACRILHQKIDSIPAAQIPVPPVSSTGELLRLGPGPGSFVGPGPFTGSVSLDTGMNLSKRVQILRLNRRGESSAHIASVLTIPLAQVELVLKLQRQTDEAPVSARS